ncbi:MAG: ribose-phosphate pyrophosphokinase [Verrucomicrobiaceae bacterium]|nr:ribose-phosphate pyrophosphokinase [Verrucomicrobiaceae bacterium]
MKDSLKVLSGSAHPELARLICQNLDTELCSVDLDAFPDGETFVQINENIRGRDVFIVQPTCPPTNQNIMELLIMVDAARRASAERITAVMPFFGYARQDRKDRPRVPITAKLVANLIAAAGVNRVLTMDLHAGQIQGFFDIPVDHLYAAPVLIKAIREREIEDLVVVSPDVGGIKMTHAYAKTLGAPMAIVAKNRVSAEEVEALNVIGDVDGKNVLLVDDLTETAGTLTAAADLLKKHGAKNIYAGVSHAVLGDKGRARIAKSSIIELFATNSVPLATGEKVTTLDISPLMAEAIKRIHGDESVTSLFDIRR